MPRLGSLLHEIKLIEMTGSLHTCILVQQNVNTLEVYQRQITDTTASVSFGKATLIQGIREKVLAHPA